VYHLVSEKQFVLYGVGEDERDEGGKGDDIVYIPNS
jgi:hypothetical protein